MIIGKMFVITQFILPRKTTLKNQFAFLRS